PGYGHTSITCGGSGLSSWAKALAASPSSPANASSRLARGQNVHFRFMARTPCARSLVPSCDTKTRPPPLLFRAAHGDLQCVLHYRCKPWAGIPPPAGRSCYNKNEGTAAPLGRKDYHDLLPPTPGGQHPVHRLLPAYDGPGVLPH